ncbi:hypothetical protein FVR03_01020 [Pontibacter qinzhouensis]|uniref:Uncharacterized protein n=1 Tax=Pontibacter qinzhouensis TaxID=2603253 RepID=A0A5C8KF73_9BACT|nr:hypothetical protein [Pontibacter qinzhouensis]TXK52325.1 hypothetical protein FVR03_01020 [Pontibacter qinzhouensis]
MKDSTLRNDTAFLNDIAFNEDTVAVNEPRLAQKSAIGVSINTSAIVKTLAVVTAILVVFSVIGSVLLHVYGYDSAYGFVPNFNLDTEGNVPSYFSALILLFAGFLFRVVALHKKKINDTFARHWTILGFLFMYLAFDEATGTHERMINPLREAFEFTGIFYFSWVIVGLLFVGGFGIYFLKFFLGLSTKYKIRFATAAIFYVGGALGVELLGGAYSSAYGEENLNYALITTVEEALEMTGIVLLIRALFKYIKSHTDSTALSFK